MIQFQMIRDVTNVTLGYVVKNTNDYGNKTFFEQYELLATIGIWSEKDTNKSIIHCHSTWVMIIYVIADHMKEWKVAIKVEVIIDILSNKKITQFINKKNKFHIWNIF